MGTSQKEDTFLTSLCEEMPGAPAPFTLGEPCPEASQCSETTAMGVTLRRQSQGVTVPKTEPNWKILEVSIEVKLSNL